MKKRNPSPVRQLSLYIEQKVAAKADKVAARDGFLYFNDVVQVLTSMWLKRRMSKKASGLLRAYVKESRQAWDTTAPKSKIRRAVKVRADIYEAASLVAPSREIHGITELVRVLIEFYALGRIKFTLRTG